MSNGNPVLLLCPVYFPSTYFFSFSPCYSVSVISSLPLCKMRDRQGDHRQNDGRSFPLFSRWRGLPGPGPQSAAWGEVWERWGRVPSPVLASRLPWVPSSFSPLISEGRQAVDYREALPNSEVIPRASPMPTVIVRVGTLNVFYHLVT